MVLDATAAERIGELIARINVLVLITDIAMQLATVCVTLSFMARNATCNATQLQLAMPMDTALILASVFVSLDTQDRAALWIGLFLVLQSD